MRSALITVAAMAAGCTAGAGQSAGPAAWTFAELLAPPSAEELAAVDADWQRKDLMPQAVAAGAARRVCFGEHCYRARWLTHRLDGEARCGLVLVPEGAGVRALAGLVDVRDIRWDYPARDLTNGPFVVTHVLREDAPRYVLVIPCLRGGVLELQGERRAAEGDRSQAWEEAAEDSIAFLTAALQTTPEIDPERLGVYGYSRGGGVALLHGQRDPRIRAVLAFAGPTDFFSHMGRRGADWPRCMEAARAAPDLAADTRESQLLDWFVRGRENEGLARRRRALAGASPAFFVSLLPRTQVHHGEDDSSVPVGNAHAVQSAAARLGRSDSVQVFTYPGAGHRLDGTEAYDRARAFLRREIGG